MYDSIPDSSLYKCATCRTKLKVWPKNKVARTRCTICFDEVINDGTNLHVCFTCSGRGRNDENHLCNSHSLSQEQNLTLVDWENDDNIFVIANHDDNDEDAQIMNQTRDQVLNDENDMADNAPPGYEEAIKYPTVSTWNDYRRNKTNQLIRQYSRLASSGSSAVQDPEAQYMVSYPSQLSANQDI